MTDRAQRRYGVLWRLEDCPAHGWYVRDDGIACKEHLRITDGGLHGLVRQHGWRGAERIIIQYGHDFERYDRGRE